jgi:hypothetical protein
MSKATFRKEATLFDILALSAKLNEMACEAIDNAKTNKHLKQIDMICAEIDTAAAEHKYEVLKEAISKIANFVFN